MNWKSANKRELTLLVVDDLALVVLLHLHVVDSGIPNVTGNSGISVAFVSNCLEERRATRAGATEDQAHFTGFQKSRVPKR